MAEYLKADRERKQIRRLFNRTATALEQKIVEQDVSAVEVDFLYLSEKFNRLRVLDEIIQSLQSAKTDFDEEEFTKEVDEAEEFLTKYVYFKHKYHILKPDVKETNHTMTMMAVPENKKNFKLPKIEIKKFDDDPKRWIQFWGQYKKIHEDRNITEEDKFQYLLQSLKDDSNARALVESFPPSAGNYPKALEQLKNRYGREEMLVEVYIRELLNMVLAQVRGELVLDLRTLYDRISTYLHALETLKVTKDRYDAMLFPLIESAMPEQVLLAYSRAQSQSIQLHQGSERLAQLLKFLENEVQAEERIRLARSDFISSKSPKTVSGSDIQPTATCLTTKVTMERGKECCYFCDKENHTVNECSKGVDLTLDEKKELIKKKGGCYICLKRGHMAKQCRAFLKCIACKRRHLVVLCPDLHSEKNKEIEVSKKPNENVTLCQDITNTLLQTVVAVVEYGGKKKKVRILMDGGSQRTYIKTSLAEELNLKVIGREQIGHTLFGAIQTKPEVYNKYEFKVSSLDNSSDITIKALAKNTALCGVLPKMDDKKVMQKLHNLNVQLSDIENDIVDIGILIGSDYMGAVISGTIIYLENNLFAMKTKLGWTLQGPTLSAYNCTVLQTCFSQTNNITDLWSIELLGIKDPQEKREQEEILKSFNDNISEAESGRYEVNLLWKEDTPDLKPNYDQAFKRLQITSKKLEKTGNLQAYDDVFQEWEKEGIIEEVKDDDKGKGHYLAHRPVIKMSSNTTKVRPVYDASMKDQNGWSLNDCMDKESKELMNMGKFDLRGWVTAPKRIDDTITVPVLGMIWNTVQDDLECSVNLKHGIKNRITKRELLSITQQVFDPLGLVSPVTLIPKLITQKAWLNNTGWDEPIPEELEKEFKEWLDTLHYINQCRFPRRLTSAPIEECETSVHVMCDASKDAYAGCIFLRTQQGDQVNVQLVLAKSRVTPTKRKMSLPKAELMGCLIASRLFTEVVNSGLLTLCKNYEVFCWTDSAVAWAWLKRQKSWKPFVSNRVTEICKNTKKEDWYHLPGNANPADLPSRGCDARTLLESRWWEGPQWLKLEKDKWPKSNINDIPIDEKAVLHGGEDGGNG
ncbi:uncharacterized protein LOC134796465 [Cydia splendana]|uniref:uncharacterized protein LOC134796465 n=1 Tax=Cydia splendana TaxID=1100963 RepID=UPI00300C0AD1